MAAAHQATPTQPTSDERVRPAQVVGYLLGGRVHTQTDRAFAENLVARWPRWMTDLRASESFCTSALRTLHGDRFDPTPSRMPVTSHGEGLRR